MSVTARPVPEGAGAGAGAPAVGGEVRRSSTPVSADDGHADAVDAASVESQLVPVSSADEGGEITTLPPPPPSSALLDASIRDRLISAAREAKVSFSECCLGDDGCVALVKVLSRNHRVCTCVPDRCMLHTHRG